MNHDWYKLYPAGVPHEIDLSSKTSIAKTIKDICDKYPDNAAITCMGTNINFSELDELSQNFASFLQHNLKLKKGDRIAIMLPNIIQFPIAFYAAQKIGLICVNTNPLYTPREMQHQFADSGAKAVVILDMFLGKLEEIKSNTKIEYVISTSLGDQLPLLKGLLIKSVMKIKGLIPKTKLACFHFKEALYLGSKKPPKLAPMGLEDIALLQYTGGTTGVSKGAVLTQKNVLANMEQIKSWARDLVGEGGDDKVLTALPLYHIFALTINFLAFLSMGAQMILIPKPVPIKNTINVFKKYRITIMTGVNTLFNSLNHSADFQKIGPRTLKIALAGGMALQNSVNKAWQEITGIPITEGFGLTEASPVTHCNPLFRDNPPGSIGVPLPSTHALIVNEQGEELGIGEPGELIVRGPQIMQGYWKKDEETAKTIKDGWLWTGDIAKRDEQGFFYIVDRKKDMVLVSGFNVYPNEIEEVLSSHPKVLECAVIGVEDHQTGEAVKAFVVKKDASLEESELRDFCKNQLTNYKRPKFYEFKKDLPKSNVGKIIRRQLRT